MDLGVLRDHIDDIDKQIIRLFEERMDVAEQVARIRSAAENLSMIR